MLLGEAEILGQLKNAYGQALDHGSTGPVLNRAFQGALEVGKRVRAETEVGGAHIINNGRIFRAGSPEALERDPEVKRIYLGETFSLRV